MLYFGVLPFLYFHAFLFSLFYYKKALEFPLFVIFPSMCICLVRTMKYMPKSMYRIFRRGKKSFKRFKKPRIHPAVEAIIWYSVIFIIYYHFHTKFGFLKTINDNDFGIIHLISGYGAFFIMSILGGLISIFIIQNFASLKKDVIPIQWKIIRNRLASVFVVYLVVILIYSGLYRLISENINKSFSIKLETTLDSIYFSVVTITTLGYGDITPVHSASKLLVITESIIGVLLLAVMIGLVISTSLSKYPKKDKTNSDTVHLKK